MIMPTCTFQHLTTSSDAAAASIVPTEDIAAQLEKETESLKDESVEGLFKKPTSEPCKYYGNCTCYDFICNTL